MKSLLYAALCCMLLTFSVAAQTTPTSSPSPNTIAETKPRKKSFRANKSQIEQAQKMFYI